MAHSHKSDNPSHGKPIHRFFGNEVQATDMKMPAAHASSQSKRAVDRYVRERKEEGRKRRG